MSIHVFGIRHHGPGCARHLRAALAELQPDILLVEGPPDAQDMLSFITSADMKPPIALLIYSPDAPKEAVYYPFTVFSPEWQALLYAQEQNIPARFIDLPQALQIGTHTQAGKTDTITKISRHNSGEARNRLHNATLTGTEPASDTPTEIQHFHEDPLAQLAHAAGYEDAEVWWERQIERRENSNNLFESILEAMTALREQITEVEDTVVEKSDSLPKLDNQDSDPSSDAEQEKRKERNLREARREAHMRQMIRAAQKEGFQKIAVVCGAWHAPVLTNPGPAKADTALLKGLKANKVAATWIPWTNSRLSYRSGYGAGVYSPGWYAHLWQVQDHSTIRWITRAAHLLREQGLDASSASVIEAVRLSETLAALRDQPQPGLAEHKEAIQTVLCHGEAVPMKLIQEKMEIGEALGQVPADVPTVPLLRDLEVQRRRLHLELSIEKQTLELDLRKETDRARSQLLHRLHLLSIPWGNQTRVRGQRGTFNEHWSLQWQVEFVVTLIEANIWGSTIASAAGGYASATAHQQTHLPDVTKLLRNTILADLPDAIEEILRAIQRLSTLTSDIQHLMDALPSLAEIARYSDVRQTRAEDILPIIESLFERSVIGLPGACSALDYNAARSMISSINHVQESIQLLNRDDLNTDWQEALRRLTENESIHGLVRGRCCRILLEQQALEIETIEHLASLALSPNGEAEDASAWIEGFLQGSGLIIINQDALWFILDRWLSQLSNDAFMAQLPILRRSFAHFQPPERRQMGDKVKYLHQKDKHAQGGNVREIERTRADLVLPFLQQLLGSNQ